MELRELRYFVAAVEAGSLTAAATALHLTQPPLTVAIHKLEAELGVQVLTRTSRGVEPTSAGRALLDAASRMLADVDDLVATMKRFGAGVAGALTLAAVPALLWHRVPRALREHARRSPEIEISLVDPPPWSAIDMVVQRAVDAAAVLVADAPRFVARHRGLIEVYDWGDVPLVLARARDGIPGEDAMSLKSLEGEVLVLPRPTAAVPSLPEVVREALARHRVVPKSVRTAETIQSSIPLIEAGVAVGVLPDADRASLTRFDLTVHAVAPPAPALRALVLTRVGATQAQPALARMLSAFGCIAYD